MKYTRTSVSLPYFSVVCSAAWIYGFFIDLFKKCGKIKGNGGFVFPLSMTERHQTKYEEEKPHMGMLNEVSMVRKCKDLLYDNFFFHSYTFTTYINTYIHTISSHIGFQANDEWCCNLRVWCTYDDNNTKHFVKYIFVTGTYCVENRISIWKNVFNRCSNSRRWNQILPNLLNTYLLFCSMFTVLLPIIHSFNLLLTYIPHSHQFLFAHFSLYSRSSMTRSYDMPHNF